MTPPSPRDRLILPLASIVAGAWAGSLVAGFVEHSYVALEVTTPVMLIVTGYVFGVSIVRNPRKNGNGNGG